MLSATVESFEGIKTLNRLKTLMAAIHAEPLTQERNQVIMCWTINLFHRSLRRAKRSSFIRTVLIVLGNKVGKHSNKKLEEQNDVSKTQRA